MKFAVNVSNCATAPRSVTLPVPVFVVVSLTRSANLTRPGCAVQERLRTDLHQMSETIEIGPTLHSPSHDSPARFTIAAMLGAPFRYHPVNVPLPIAVPVCATITHLLDGVKNVLPVPHCESRRNCWSDSLTTTSADFHVRAFGTCEYVSPLCS